MSMQKLTIQLQVNDKAVNAYQAAPADGGPGVLVLHAWWGLKPFFQQLCDRLAQQGFVVLAPDLNDGRVAQTVDEAKELMDKRDYEFMGAIIMAAKDYLRAYGNLKGEKIGVVGFSMGAAWALDVAVRTPEQIAATVLFYGTYGGLDFGKISSKIQGHFSPDDEWEPLDSVQSIVNDMKSAGVDITLYIYPDTKHWFMEDDRPEYDAAAATLAWERTLGFLKENLPQ
jgi:carboxymethylenebutenolidase